MGTLRQCTTKRLLRTLVQKNALTPKIDLRVETRLKSITFRAPLKTSAFDCLFEACSAIAPACLALPLTRPQGAARQARAARSSWMTPSCACRGGSASRARGASRVRYWADRRRDAPRAPRVPRVLRSSYQSQGCASRTLRLPRSARAPGWRSWRASACPGAGMVRGDRAGRYDAAAAAGRQRRRLRRVRRARDAARRDALHALRDARAAARAHRGRADGASGLRGDPVHCVTSIFCICICICISRRPWAPRRAPQRSS